jgi:hypothetical protein
VAQGAGEAFADRVHARRLHGGAQDPGSVVSKTASSECVKFGPRSRIRNLMPPDRSWRARARLRPAAPSTGQRGSR